MVVSYGYYLSYIQNQKKNMVPFVDRILQSIVSNVIEANKKFLCICGFTNSKCGKNTCAAKCVIFMKSSVELQYFLR